MFRWGSSLDHAGHRRTVWTSLIIKDDLKFVKNCASQNGMHGMACMHGMASCIGRWYAFITWILSQGLSISRDILRIYKHISTLLVGLYKFECSLESLEFIKRYGHLSYAPYKNRPICHFFKNAKYARPSAFGSSWSFWSLKRGWNGHNWWLAVWIHLNSFSDFRLKIILDGFNGWPPKIFVNRRARQIRNYGLKLS